VYLYALVTADSDFAVDLFISKASAEAALAEVLHDEPAFAPFLSVATLPPPWKGAAAFELHAHPQ
jgi:hypothetical protein